MFPSFLTQFVLFVTIGYVALLLSRRILEPFSDGGCSLGNTARPLDDFTDQRFDDKYSYRGMPVESDADIQNKKNSEVIMEQRIEAPYVQNPIYSLDDYEYNLVFQNENDKELSKAEKNRLTAQYPLDWSIQPPSSAVFQKGISEMRQRQDAARYEEAFQDIKENPYREIDGSTMTPPDTRAMEMEERKIIQTYKPAKADSLTTYDLEDAQNLIQKIYKAKGLIPDVITKENNVFEIVGTRKIGEKVLFEDELAPASTAPVAKAGEGTITVPPTAVDLSVGLDPFYTPTDSERTGRWDYNKWTPGLERSFAPTYATEKWQ